MALNAYLTLKGQKQGPINGSVTQKGRENTILVHAYAHEVVSPRDAMSGLPTGKRQHKPFTIVKEVDKSSPLLWTALCTNENIVSFDLKFWAPSRLQTPVETQYYTITLTNANIASIRESMPDNQDPAKAPYPLRERGVLHLPEDCLGLDRWRHHRPGRLGSAHRLRESAPGTPQKYSTGPIFTPQFVELM